MSDEADDTSYQTLFNDQIAARGGLERLTALDTEIISIICKLLISVRGADAESVPKLAATIAQLQTTLPAQVAADADKPWNLALLTDAELQELTRLEAIALGEAPPTPEPVVPERQEGEAERVGSNLGRWIDERKEGWRFGRPSEAEKIHLRNEFSEMGYPLIVRDLWADIYRSDLQGEIERAVKNALAAVGRDDVKLIPGPCEELKRIDFHIIPSRR
jgi:hypothetical protein